MWLSLARAPGLGPGGRRFESCHPDSNICASGSVVEYRLAKARVAGSNPVSRSYLKKVVKIFFFCAFFHLLLISFVI